MKPLLSIAVPTKDRYEYLIPLISLIKGFNSDEIELVIQDNTVDNSKIINYINELNYSRLKYYHTKEQISVGYNADLAILNSTGKFVCLIGDDDGVSGHIISAVKWMEKMNIDVLKTAFGSYKWPSFNFSKISDFSSVLMLSFYDKKYKKINSIDQLKKSLRNGANSRHGITVLPKVYHGIAKRSTLDKIYNIGGTFFPGPSPDMANSVALCFVTENFVFLDLPIVIPGNSSRTGGDSKKFKGQRAQISEVPFLPANTEKNWETFIPKVWSSQTIMPETACKSLKYMGKEEYIEKYLNKEKMLANFTIAHLALKKLAYEKSTNKAKLSIYVLFYMISKISIAIYNKVLYALFSVLYAGASNTGGIFNSKNYFKVMRNLGSIIDANAYILKIEERFEIK